MALMRIDVFNDETEARAWAQANGGDVHGPMEGAVLTDHTVDPPQMKYGTPDGTYWIVIAV